MPLRNEPNFQLLHCSVDFLLKDHDDQVTDGLLYIVTTRINCLFLYPNITSIATLDILIFHSLIDRIGCTIGHDTITSMHAGFRCGGGSGSGGIIVELISIYIQRTIRAKLSR